MYCFSFVTLGELTKRTVLRSWGLRQRAEMAGWLGNVVVLPYSEAVAITWGLKGKPATPLSMWRVTFGACERSAGTHRSADSHCF